MKRFIALMLALLLCLPCALAEEIAPLVQSTPVPPTDPNEIAPLVQSTPVPPTDPNEIGALVQEEPTAAPVEIGSAIEDIGGSAEVAVAEETAAQLTASGEVVSLNNVVLAIPTGWTVAASQDGSDGGPVLVSLESTTGTNEMMQAQSQPIGTEESVNNIITMLGAESFLSQTLIGTMQRFGIVIEEYEFAYFIGDLPCVRASEIITLSGVECAMNMAVMLDGVNMVVIMLALEGYDTTAGMEALNVVMSPMMAQ